MKKLALLMVFLLPAVSFAAFDTNLTYGSKGDSVTELQEFLTEQGVYTGPISGNFYALTRAGVKAYQFKEGIIPAAGFWGPITRGKAKILADAQGAAADAQAVGETGTTTTVKNTQAVDTHAARLDAIASELAAIKEQTKPVVAPVIPTVVVVKPFEVYQVNYVDKSTPENSYIIYIGSHEIYPDSTKVDGVMGFKLLEMNSFTSCVTQYENDNAKKCGGYTYKLGPASISAGRHTVEFRDTEGTLTTFRFTT